MHKLTLIAFPGLYPFVLPKTFFFFKTLVSYLQRTLNHILSPYRMCLYASERLCFYQVRSLRNPSVDWKLKTFIAQNWKKEITISFTSPAENWRTKHRLILKPDIRDVTFLKIASAVKNRAVHNKLEPRKMLGPNHGNQIIYLFCQH